MSNCLTSLIIQSYQGADTRFFALLGKEEKWERREKVRKRKERSGGGEQGSGNGDNERNWRRKEMSRWGRGLRWKSRGSTIDVTNGKCPKQNQGLRERVWRTGSSGDKRKDGREREREREKKEERQERTGNGLFT